MASLGSAWKSFWHTMTSYDRHSSYDSPYRTGQHVPLSQSRHAPLTSVATTASESRADVSSPYFVEDHERQSTTALNGTAYPASPISHHSPGPHSPYSPGMRSAAALQRTSSGNNFENVTPGGIQLQPFQEGLPPAPPVTHSWKRIDRWAEENYEELHDQLCEGCTNNDLNELEHQLDCSLPMEVRESLQVHDGQERGGLPTGIIFGSMLLDCEEIVQEWENWKKVNQEYLNEPVITLKPVNPARPLGGGSSASSSKPAPQTSPNPHWRQDLLARQASQPPNAIQKVYAHPAWIPLARDWGGNNLAVDLAPGPAGKWGQVILFGRDYDCKYVVARSWSAFIATVADDLNSGKWFVDEDTNELKLREFRRGNVEPGYLEILRWRVDQKYGRRNAAKRRSAAPSPAKAGMPSASPIGSPYASPVAEAGEMRGRSMQRFGGASPVESPVRAGFAKSSPLARVQEESAAPRKMSLQTNGLKPEKLVEVETPRPSEDVKSVSKSLEGLLSPVNRSHGSRVESEVAEMVNGSGSGSGNSNANADSATAASRKTKEQQHDDGMKTIEI